MTVHLYTFGMISSEHLDVCLHITFTQCTCVGHLLCDRDNAEDTKGDWKGSCGEKLESPFHVIISIQEKGALVGPVGELDTHCL